MKIDAPGLVAAAQRLLDAVVAVGGAEVPHRRWLQIRLRWARRGG